MIQFINFFKHVIDSMNGLTKELKLSNALYYKRIKSEFKIESELDELIAKIDQFINEMRNTNSLLNATLLFNEKMKLEDRKKAEENELNKKGTPYDERY